MAEHEIVIRVRLEQVMGIDVPQVMRGGPTTTEFVEVGAGKDRTPSQELRLAMMRKYAQLNKLGSLKEVSGEAFEGWYKEQMERIISVITNQK